MDVARAAIAGGCDLVQVREKEMTGGPLLALARAVVEAALPVKSRCAVVVNDRLDVALAARAAGVHLPSMGLAIGPMRRATSKTFLIGRSVHSLAEARQAQKDGADYLVFGPVFETPSKTAFGPPQGIDALARVARAVRIPVWAIGGIDPARAQALRGTRIAGIAAISFIARAADPAEAVRLLKSALNS